jgi:hypothetical protein
MSKLIVQSFGAVGLPPVDLMDAPRKSEVTVPSKVTGGVDVTIDANFWLPLAAEKYHVSPSLRDYLMIPVPGLISDIPNTNGDSVSKAQLLNYIPSMGMPAYKTFKGKPTHTEHENKDITRAKGIILDSILRPLKGYGGGRHYKMILLLAFDRTKDPVLTQKIARQEINTYSIGMYYDSYTCSICGNTVGKDFGSPCEHTQHKRPTYQQPDGRLAYRHCNGIIGFETSSVKDPAYVVAVSDHVLNK